MHVSPGSIAQKTISTKPKLKFLTVNNSLSSSKWICTSILLPFFPFLFLSLSLFTRLSSCSVRSIVISLLLASLRPLIVPPFCCYCSFVGEQHHSLYHAHLRTNQKKFDRFSSSVHGKGSKQRCRKYRISLIQWQYFFNVVGVTV